MYVHYCNFNRLTYFQNVIKDVKLMGPKHYHMVIISIYLISIKQSRGPYL